MLHLKFFLSEGDVPPLLYIRFNVHSSLKIVTHYVKRYFA